MGVKVDWYWVELSGWSWMDVNGRIKRSGGFLFDELIESNKIFFSSYLAIHAYTSNSVLPNLAPSPSDT